MAEAEIRYYFRLRKKRSVWSGIFRWCGWAFGTIGALLPLVAPALPLFGITFEPWSKGASLLGYVFLALAGSAFGANALFGASTGHARFVLAQLALERIMTKSRIDWCDYSIKLGSSSNAATLKEGFSLIQRYADNLYETVMKETMDWKDVLLAEQDKAAGETRKGKK